MKQFIFIQLLLMLCVSVVFSHEVDDASPYIIFTAYDGSGSNIVQIDPDGANETYLTNILGELYTRYVDDVDCVNDGKTLYFSTGDLYSLNLEKDNTLTLIDLQGIYDNVSVSADGNSLAYAQLGINEIFMRDLETQTITQLTTPSRFEFDPDWSPTDDAIVFAYQEDQVRGLAILDINSASVTNLTRGEANESNPSWSPDGQHIAYTSDLNGTFNIYVMDIEDLEVIQLTFEGNNLNPAWSPDGEKISFSSDRDGDDYEIYIMDADGENQTRITDNITDDYNQCWLNTISDN